MKVSADWPDPASAMSSTRCPQPPLARPGVHVPTSSNRRGARETRRPSTRFSRLPTHLVSTGPQSDKADGQLAPAKVAQALSLQCLGLSLLPPKRATLLSYFSLSKTSAQTRVSWEFECLMPSSRLLLDGVSLSLLRALEESGQGVAFCRRLTEGRASRVRSECAALPPVCVVLAAEGTPSVGRQLHLEAPLMLLVKVLSPPALLPWSHVLDRRPGQQQHKEAGVGASGPSLAPCSCPCVHSD